MATINPTGNEYFKVTDPGTGITYKTTAYEVDGFNTPVIDEFVGDWASPVYILVPNLSVSVGDKVYIASGPAIAGLNYAGMQHVTSYSTNIASIILFDGSQYGHNVTSDTMTSFSMPELYSIIGPNYYVRFEFPNVEKLTFPKLTVVTTRLNITAKAIELPSLKVVFDSLYLTCDNVSLSLALETCVGYVSIIGPQLKTLDCSRCKELYLSIYGDCPLVEELLLDDVVTGDIGFETALIKQFNMPNLKYGGFYVGDFSLVTSMDFSSFELSSYLYILDCPLLTSLSFPKLKTAAAIQITGMTQLQSVAFPSLENFNYQYSPLTIEGPSVASITFGSLKELTNGIDFSGCALTQASVDNILVELAALDGSNGTVSFNNKTVTLNGGTNAAPSATGLAAKAILVARGCTVNHN